MWVFRSNYTGLWRLHLVDFSGERKPPFPHVCRKSTPYRKCSQNTNDFIKAMERRRRPWSYFYVLEFTPNWFISCYTWSSGQKLLVWNPSMAGFSHLCGDVDNLPSMHHNSMEVVVRGGGWEWGWNRNKKTLVLSLI